MDESGPTSWVSETQVVNDRSNNDIRRVATSILGALGVFAVLFAVAVPIGLSGHLIAGAMVLL